MFFFESCFPNISKISDPCRILTVIKPLLRKYPPWESHLRLKSLFCLFLMRMCEWWWKTLKYHRREEEKSTYFINIYVQVCGNTIYIISSVMHAFWLVLTYDLLEDRRIDDVIIKTFFPYILILYYIKSCYRSQRTSKCGKNISDTLGCTSCATFLFLPHFDVIYDLLLNRRTETWNLFVN